MKRLVPFFLTVIMAIFIATATVYADNEEDTTVIAPFTSGYLPDNESIRLKLKSGFDFLEQGSETLNWELALTGAVLSKEVYDFTSDPKSNQNEPEIYMFSESDKDETARSTVQPTLIALGYTNTSYYYYENSVLHPSACFGYKRYDEDQDGKFKNVFVIVVRGTHSFEDGITDFFNGGLRTFEEATLNVRNDFVNFAEKVTEKKIEDLRGEDNLFFITGHSLGAVVANRLSITDTIVDLVGNDKNKIYTYTFEAPHSCFNYWWMDPKGMSNAFNFKDVDDLFTNVPIGVGATRYGTDLEFSVGKDISMDLYEGITGMYIISELNQEFLNRVVENLDNQIFMTLFPNAKGGSVIEAPKFYKDIFGHHDMGLPLTYILQKGIEANIWESVEDVILMNENNTVEEPALKKESLSWIEAPKYVYDDVEPVYSPDFGDGISPICDGVRSLFHADDVLHGVEMNFPSYSCLEEYYNVFNGDTCRLFYMPEKIDSDKLTASDPFSIYDCYGIIYDPDPFSNNYMDVDRFDVPWDVFWLHGDGMVPYYYFGNLFWDQGSQCAYMQLKSQYENISILVPATEIPLHKEYAIQKGDVSGNMVLGKYRWEDGESPSFEIQIDRTNKYALWSPKGNLLTDFIYDEMESSSYGIVAACKNGKWGYLDEQGREITEFIYDAPWQIGNGYSCAYPCTSDTMVVSLNGEMGVLYKDGSLLIDFGEFKDIAPAWNDELWVKQDNLWGLIDLAKAKEQKGCIFGDDESSVDIVKKIASYEMIKDERDKKGYDVEVYFERPIFAETMLGYQLINEFFEEQSDIFFSDRNTYLNSLWEIAEEFSVYDEDVSQFYLECYVSTEIIYQSEDLVSVLQFHTQSYGGSDYCWYEGYLFHTDTGKQIRLTEIIDGTEAEIKDMIERAICSEYNVSDAVDYNNVHSMIAEYALEDFNFYLKGKEIHITFPKYALVVGPLVADITLPVPSKLQ